MIGPGNDISRRKINLDVIDRQLEDLKVAKTPAENALLEKLCSEVKRLNDQFVQILKNYSSQLTRDKKLSYEAIAEQYRAQIDEFAEQLTVLGQTMIDGSTFDISISKSVRGEIKRCGQDLQSLAKHKPDFKFSPVALQMINLCTSLGGFSIAIGQEMQNFTCIEVTTRKNNKKIVKIESSLGECAGIQHKWATEIVATGTPSYPIAISMEVSCYQAYQSVIQNNQYTKNKPQQLKDVNVEMMLTKLEAGVPHLLGLRDDKQSTGHALGLRRHPDSIEIVDPNFGYFFFADATKASAWLNALLQLYYAIDFPCSQLELSYYSAMSADLIKPAVFPTRREVEKDFAKPYTEDGYKKMVEALRRQFVYLLEQADDKKLAVIMLKSFNAFVDCVSDDEIQQLKRLVESFVTEEQLTDKDIIIAYCGSVENYNRLKQIMIKDGISGLTNLLGKLSTYKNPAALIPKQVVDFMNQVEVVEQALRIASTDIAERIEAAKKDNDKTEAKQLDYRLRVLGMKQTQLLKAAIVPTLKAKFARDKKCDLDNAIAAFKEQVGTALDPNELQPHLNELKAIDRAKEGLQRFCKTHENKYSTKDKFEYFRMSVRNKVLAEYERAEDDVAYELAKRDIKELEEYNDRILSTAAKDANQSIREARFEDLLSNKGIGDYLDTEKANRLNRNMQRHEGIIQTLSVISVEPCVEKLEALNVKDDQWENPDFAQAVQCVMALQNEVRRAVYHADPMHIDVAGYQRTLESILVDIENIGKENNAKKVKRPVIEVTQLDQVDVSSDASVSKTDDHESEAEDTVSTQTEEIIINERKEVTANEDAVESDTGHMMDEAAFNDLLDEALLTADTLIVLNPAITSLIAYKKWLNDKIQVEEALLNHTQNVDKCAEISRKLRSYKLRLVFAQRKIDELQASCEHENVEACEFAKAINARRNIMSDIDEICHNQLLICSETRMREYGKKADSISAIDGLVGQDELTLRQLNLTHKLDNNPVYNRTLEAIQKLQEDICLDKHGMLRAETDIERYKARRAGIEKDIKLIESNIAKQKEEVNVSAMEPVPVRVASNEVASVITLSQEALELQNAFLAELAVLKQKIAASKYCSKRDYNNNTAKAEQEKTLTDNKLRLIGILESKVSANKSLNLADVIGTFLHGEFTFEEYESEYGKRRQIINRELNRDILFKHRRTSGFLSIFNRTTKTDTQKLLEKYHAAATKANSRKRKRGCV